MKYYLAIDIGASSGRHILSHVEHGKIILEEIYRFDNIQILQDGHNCWNIDYLFSNIKAGIKKCKKLNKIPCSLGIDTWGVDYILLDKNDNVIGNAIAYRDKYTENIDKSVNNLISDDDLYKNTGIQKQIFNSIYQLMARKKEAPTDFDKAETFLMIPEYFNFLLTGNKVNEYTNATTTNLVNAEEKNWDWIIINKLGLPKTIFKKLHMPTEIVGNFKNDIKNEVGFDCTVLLPATHDTGSAFLSVPAENDTSVYISSGTWSLLGVENKFPITTKKSMQQNFTNEGGAFYRYRYLKNIMGLWMIQSIRRELNGTSYVVNNNPENNTEKHKYSFDDLVNEAKKSMYFHTIIDVNDDSFLSPDSMITAVKQYCENNNLDVPETVGEVMQCVYQSLAFKYAESIKILENLTGKKYTDINIVGGGCKDSYLNELTAKYSGLKVHAGPVEGTALGNIVIQMLYSKEFNSLSSARASIKTSFNIVTL